jgi:CubicO group peptidase (beta-lactamase class C family)
LETLRRVVEIVFGQTLDRYLRQRIFDPLDMRDTSFHVAPKQRARAATIYHRANNALVKVDAPDWLNGAYLTGAGGLLSDAADYLQFSMMLANCGQLERQATARPEDGGLGVVDIRAGYAAGADEGPQLRAERAGDQRRGGSQHARIQRKLRLGRRFRHALLGGSQGENCRDSDDSDRQSDRPLNGEFENAVMQAVVE